MPRLAESIAVSGATRFLSRTHSLGLLCGISHVIITCFHLRINVLVCAWKINLYAHSVAVHASVKCSAFQQSPCALYEKQQCMCPCTYVSIHHTHSRTLTWWKWRGRLHNIHPLHNARLCVARANIGKATGSWNYGMASSTYRFVPPIFSNLGVVWQNWRRYHQNVVESFKIIFFIFSFSFFRWFCWFSSCSFIFTLTKWNFICISTDWWRRRRRRRRLVWIR